jgi:hypothetical protein
VKPKKLEEFSDRALKRLDVVAEEHFSGKRDDGSACVQARVSNATARQISTNIQTRRQSMREAIAA